MLGFKSPLFTKFAIPCDSNYFQTLITIDLPSKDVMVCRIG